jgi:hypothetical protein
VAAKWAESVGVEVGRALEVQKGLDRIRTRRVQADFSEWRVAQSDVDRVTWLITAGWSVTPAGG